MPRGKFSADRSQFLLGRLFSEDLPGYQVQYRTLDHAAQIPQRIPCFRKQRHDGLVVFGNATRLGKILQQRADLAIGGQTCVADGMNDQPAVLADRQLMNKARSAQDHASL